MHAKGDKELKYLHIADLHLGLKTDGRDRLEEQRKIMTEIVTLCEVENVDVVLIAGDIFHNSVPSAEAEDLFINTLERLAGKQERVVCVIAGNHDDPERLGAILPLAMKHNIFISTTLDEVFTIAPQEGPVKVVEAGQGYIAIEKDADRAVVTFLPYVSDARMHSLNVQDLPYDKKVIAYADMLGKHFKPGAFRCMLAHAFARNAKLHGADTTLDMAKVGELLSVDMQDLPHVDYLALGHLHTYQCANKHNHAYYSGSCIQMEYDDSVKGVVVFEGTAKQGVKNMRFIPLQSVYPMKSIVVKSYAEAVEVLQNEPENALLEVTFVQYEPLSSSMVKELKSKFKNVVTIRLELLQIAREGEETDITYRKEMSATELFKAFYQKVRGVEPSEQLTEMFANLMEGSDETN